MSRTLAPRYPDRNITVSPASKIFSRSEGLPTVRNNTDVRIDSSMTNFSPIPARIGGEGRSYLNLGSARALAETVFSLDHRGRREFSSHENKVRDREGAIASTRGA